MASKPQVGIPKWVLQVLNNVYEIEQKLSCHGDQGNAKRNIDKINDILRTENIFSMEGGLFYENPYGQEFKETRTDLEVSISGDSTENLVVIDVIKPIIRFGTSDFSQVVQKGIVIVQAKTEDKAL